MASLAEAAQILLGFRADFDSKIGAGFRQQAAALLGKFRQELLATQNLNDLAQLDEKVNGANERFQQQFDSLVNQTRQQSEQFNQKLDEYSSQGNPDDPSVSTYIREYISNYEDLMRRKQAAVLNAALAKELTPAEVHPFTAYEFKYNFKGEKSLVVH